MSSQGPIGMPGPHSNIAMNQPMGAQMSQPQGPPPQMMGMRPGPGGHQHQQPPPAYSQTPLAYLEQTMSNIGMPDQRR